MKRLIANVVWWTAMALLSLLAFVTVWTMVGMAAQHISTYHWGKEASVCVLVLLSIIGFSIIVVWADENRKG